jgi:RimJ/RimL family protein N-acetyltransferase
MTSGSRSQFTTDDLPSDFPRQTNRLTFTPASGDFADAVAVDHGDLSNHIGAEVPRSWPPKNVSPPGEDSQSGWRVFYLTHTHPDNRHVAVGFAGMKKWSPEHGTIQIGTALVPEYHGQHLGEEVVRALAEWGVSQPDVRRVICDVPRDHAASAKSLERAGFLRDSVEHDPGFVRFELKKPAD